MSSVTRTGGTNQPAVDLDSPPKLRRSSRDNRQSSSRRTNNGASTKSRRQERDATPRVRNIKADDVPSSDHYMYYDSHHSRRGRLERSKYYVSEEDEDEDEDGGCTDEEDFFFAVAFVDVDLGADDFRESFVDDILFRVNESEAATS
mmetsp:Transcript_27213/g.59554  ORF Transcript_27213/g.59554 Transcript_27213/m.59554 type:complete len:147 (+) Transcript_27213:158-598(+)